MRTNPVKHKLQNREPTYGTWLSLGDWFAARVLALQGWDWLTLDLEHQPIDWQGAAQVFATVADAGCVPLCRVPEGTHFYIKRALDAGAWGIVVPMVNTVEQARTAIAAAKYPPQGNRSVGGGLHALNWNAPPAEYFARANEEILVILQTESPAGVRQAAEIYALPGCDAIFVGPNDLRAQMHGEAGHPPSNEEFEATLARIIKLGEQAGVPTGMHVTSATAALARAEQGMRFLAVGSDLQMLARQSQQVLSELFPQREVEAVVRY
ncbi:MAG: aldolase/citrate lyase family protein [Pirellulales bacterium]|nr:aldolase/citrate lyase family protein [Pirellulales bacterium]